MSENETTDETPIDGQPPAESADASPGPSKGSPEPRHSCRAAGDSAQPAQPVVKTASIVEAMLLATDSPIGASKIAQIIGDVTAGQVRECVQELNAGYERAGTAFRIEEIAKGYQILTLPEYNVWLRKLLRVRDESKLSQAALETLAVVAYRQPVLRAVIEEIRGVQGGEVLQRLREMNLVKIVGRAEELGRPLLYGTTKRFLTVFGLASLSELPKVEALTPPEKQPASNGPGAGETEAADASDAEAPGKDDTATASEGDKAFARLAEAAKQSEPGERKADDATN